VDLGFTHMSSDPCSPPKSDYAVRTGCGYRLPLGVPFTNEPAARAINLTFGIGNIIKRNVGHAFKSYHARNYEETERAGGQHGSLPWFMIVYEGMWARV
jgi:hypothetical protein